MSQGTESTTYRRAAYLEAKRLGVAPPQFVPQPIPAKSLTPEFRRAKQLEAQRLGLPEPNFGPTPAPAFDPWAGSGLPSGLKRTSAPAQPNAQPPANPAPDRQLSSDELRLLYLADCRKFGGVHERMPPGTTWSPEVSRRNWGV
jgi:hypothetical protein